MKQFKLLISSVLLLGASLFLLQGCGDKEEDDNVLVPSAQSYDRQVLLSNWANNYILPAYGEYTTQLTALKNEVTNFNSTPTVATLQTLRTQWENTLLVWQDVAFLELGPASNISLRAQTNVYPVDTMLINSNINSGTYNLQLPSNFDAKGFQAMDYLINGKGSVDADVVNYYNNTTNAELYLQDVVDELELNATSVNNSWQTSYATSFIANSASNAQGSSVSDAINALVMHYETYVRKGKVGLPAGVFNGFSQVPLPTHVEALYYEQSLPFIYRSLIAIQKFINGESYTTNVNGEGLDDYMNFVQATSGGQALETVIDNQIEVVKTSLATINDPFSTEVTTNNANVRSVYEEMQKLVPSLKVDMTNALDVLITYQDTDGD